MALEFLKTGVKEIPVGEWESYPMKMGDVFRLTYKKGFLTTQGQIDAVINEVARDERFRILDYKDTDASLVLTVKILQNPIPIAVLVAAIAAASIAVFLFLSLDKIEQIASTPAGIGFMVVALIAGIFVLRGLLKGG